MNTYLNGLVTEKSNKKTFHIDKCSTIEMLKLMNDEDRMVPDAVSKEIPHIAGAVDTIYMSLKKGGHLIYVGAGTSGRLGILDAAECVPTFGTDPSLVQGYIAGGDAALRSTMEGCEDDAQAGADLIRECKVAENDVVIGISASGSAKYVISAVKEAKKRNAAAICVVNNENSVLSKYCDICISPIVGPEVIAGSTRLKAGTSQKLVLNMLTTCTMIKLGKVYGNLMVDLKATNEKLYDRAVRIVCGATDVDEASAVRYLEKSGMNTKLAIMMAKTGLNRADSLSKLEENGGMLEKAVESAKS